MGGFNNPRQGNLADIERRLAAVENRTTLNNAAVGRAGMEVYDGGSLNISNGTFYLNGYGSVAGTLAVSGTLPVTGGLIVSGTERITGSWFLDGVGEVAGTMTVTGGLIVDGTQRVSGTLEITGDLNVTGPTKLNGTTDIGGNTTVTGTMDVEGPMGVSGTMDVEGPMGVTGTLDIKGKSTLQNDLVVTNGGSVKVGGMTLDPVNNGGSIQFINGAYLISNGGVTSLAGSGDAYVTLSADMAQIRGAKVALNGQLSNPNYATAPANAKPNMYMDSNGNIQRIVVT